MDKKTKNSVWQADWYFVINRKDDGQLVKVSPLGYPTYLSLSGDWNGHRCDEVGVWEQGRGHYYLYNNSDGAWDADKGDSKLGPYGESFDTPITGNWDGGRKDMVGVWDPYTRLFHVNTGGDGKW